ncbi:MAG: hypothetical protein ACKOGA_01520, partial [Planctomycetaceae bacterium]
MKTPSTSSPGRAWDNCRISSGSMCTEGEVVILKILAHDMNSDQRETPMFHRRRGASASLRGA